MKRKYLTYSMVLLFGLYATPAFSQNSDFLKNYQQHRKAMLDDYQKFRNTVLTDYDKYLQGVWKDFQRFKGDKRNDEVPKPKEAPVCTNYILPEVVVCAEPKMPVSPVAPVERPSVEPVKNPDFFAQKPNIEIPDIDYTGSGIDVPLMPVVPDIPLMPALPKVAYVHVPMGKRMVSVDYYGETLQFQDVSQITTMNIVTHEDVASYWKLLKQSELKDVTQAFATEVRRLGLSDWASAMLVEKYLDVVMPKASSNEKVVATQYILANCGYNVRLGMNGNQVTMLISYAEHVYEKSYINIDGQKYYIYPDINDDGVFRSCELPKDAELGKSMELRFTGKAQLGDETKRFYHEAAGITISGEVPAGIMALLDDYPIVDIPTVASSIIDKSIRTDVVEQIRAQVQGMDEQKAANQILRFVQKGFEYATDDEQFNREKYFYFEEMLYYPKNDCEDRAIFYAYLVHEILGLDVHLIQFPGHECTAVAFNVPIEFGTSYEYKGKRYYICDPTYIGANIGRCMPAFAKVSPQIEVWY